MNNIFKFILPFSYFWQSRLKEKKDVLFHFWYEWLSGFLLLSYFYNWNFRSALPSFFLAYIAFICIYELGYFANDIYAVKFEDNPRKRIKNFDPSIFTIAVWVIARLIAFGGVTYYFGLLSSIIWWGFYATLLVVYFMHNFIKNEQYKLVTFFQLAIIRFVAPIFIFIDSNLWRLIIVPVIVNYVLYRTITYMESKGLTNLSERTFLRFKLNYYVLFFPIGIFLSIFEQSFVPLFIHLYFIVFWGVLFWGSKNRR